MKSEVKLQPEKDMYDCGIHNRQLVWVSVPIERDLACPSAGICVLAGR